MNCAPCKGGLWSLAGDVDSKEAELGSRDLVGVGQGGNGGQI
jgi:hypothetical protein